MAEVRLERIEKQFGTTAVLTAIGLVIRDGEFFTLVGPSGCGKSTLLNLIAGLEVPTAGEIYFDAEPIGHLAPRDRDVAMVFQSYALYPHMTVYENLAFPLRMRRRPAAEIDRRVKAVAEMLGLTPAISRRPAELSGGQRQRVALGRAIVREPRVFLLDEPLSNLDAQLRIEMRGELKRLHRRLGATMIYVTHDQAEAMTLSDRMAVLWDGRVQQCGTPREIYDRPANLFVAQFIGSPPMNLLRAVLSGGPPFHLELGQSRYPLPAGMIGSLRAAAQSREVICGIRPEHLRLSRVKEGDASAAQISLVEPMGAEAWIELEWDGQRLRARGMAEIEGAAGETAFVSIDQERISLFDPGSGLRIVP